MYDTYLITLIDVLGFKKIMQEKYLDQPSKIIEILEKFRSSIIDASSFYGTYDGEEFQIRYFSDLIIRYHKITGLNTKDVQGILYYELTNLGWSQGSLFQDGIFVRGAMDIGKLYVNDNHLFGDAFNSAYDIESQISKFPIILISNNVMNVINDNYSNIKLKVPGVHTDLQTMITDKYHSHYYIDFMLQAPRVRGVLDEDSCDSELLFYRDVLQEAISENIKNPYILTKLLWLKEYYNYTVIRHKRVLSSYKKLLLYPKVSKNEIHIGHAWMCSYDCH